MPNQPKTPMHSFRVDDDLWRAAQAAAEVNGETVTDVLKRSLQSYVRRTQRTANRQPDSTRPDPDWTP